MARGRGGEVDRPGFGERRQEVALAIGAPAGELVVAFGQFDPVEGGGGGCRLRRRKQVRRPGDVLVDQRHDRQARPAALVGDLDDGAGAVLRRSPSIESSIDISRCLGRERAWGLLFFN
jgi:hypothetical protein